MPKDKLRLKLVNNQTGSLFFPMIILIGMVVFASSYYFSQMMLARKLDSSRLVATMGLKATMLSAQAMLYSQHSLIQTLKSNLNGDLWKCVNDVEYDCAQFTPKPMTLMSEIDNVVFLSSNPASGMTVNFKDCYSFPSLSCPFRYQIEWYVECPTAALSCKAPDVFVQGKLMVTDAAENRININSQNYNFLMKVK